MLTHNCYALAIQYLYLSAIYASCTHPSPPHLHIPIPIPIHDPLHTVFQPEMARTVQQMIQQFSRLNLLSQQYPLSQVDINNVPLDVPSSAIVKLDSLQISNFKSFDQKYIGPFLNFTCIIGPNGSGKSNILEAVMFCLCSQSSRHSLADARELINRQGKQTFKQLSRQNKVCSVECIFVLANEQKFILRRTLDAESREQLFVNFKQVNKQEYLAVLLHKGINPMTPNYAIWQGQIDRLILKDPLQLTSLLESLSGSIHFKREYDELKSQLASVHSTIQEQTRRINKLKQQKRAMRVIKQSTNEHNKYEQQYTEILNKIYHLNLLQKQRQIEVQGEQLQKQVQEQAKRVAQLNRDKLAVQNQLINRATLQEQLRNVMTELQNLHTLLKDSVPHVEVIKRQKLKLLQHQLQQQGQQLDRLTQKKQSIVAALPDTVATPELQQYLQLYTKWQYENTALHRQIQKRTTELLYIQTMLASKHEMVRQHQSRVARFKQRRQNKKQDMANIESDLRKVNESIRMMEAQTEHIHARLGKNKIESIAKAKLYEDVCATVEEYERVIEDQAQDAREGELLKNLASIDGFHGALHQKIRPNAGKYDVCFSILFNTVRKYLLCQSEEAAKKLGNRLRELHSSKNIIILDNVPRRQGSNIRKQLGKDGVMGIDIVDLDGQTKGLKEYLSEYLQGKVICESVDIAYKVRQRGIDGVHEIHTLDGTVLKTDGSVSTYGNTQPLRKLLKLSSGTNKNLYKQLSVLHKQRQQLQSQLGSMQSQSAQNELSKHKSQLAQLELNKSKLQLQLNELNKSDKQPTLPHAIIQQLAQLQQSRDKVQSRVLQLQQMVGRSQIFDKFMHKYNVQSLQRFRQANNMQAMQVQMQKKKQMQKEISVIDATINKIHKHVYVAQMEANRLEDELREMPDGRDRGKIQQRIQQLQARLVQIRNSIAKISVVKSVPSFVSLLPGMQAKFNYAKQKIAKDMEDLAYDLGVEFKYPVAYEQIQEVLALPRKVTDRALEALGQKLSEQRAKIQQNLDKHNSINLLQNVQEDEDKIQRGMQEANDEVKAIIEDRKALTDKIDDLRKNRGQVLRDFVYKLKQHLNRAYSILTLQEDGSHGSIALHMENQSQPFDYGIYFTPTPPTKRFIYDLEQLSGGEKSIASLALQYSLSLASGSPFLILDQTDAFLDQGNVTRFLSLVMQSPLTHRNLQMLIVTHKQGLFGKAESLVGVSRPKCLNLSQVYSLRLADE